LYLDDLAKAARRLLLLIRPQAVALDKTQRFTPGSSLRAKRSNPSCSMQGMDCFVAALLAMTVNNRRPNAITPPP
jgi:hypothetical protein